MQRLTRTALLIPLIALACHGAGAQEKAAQGTLENAKGRKIREADVEKTGILPPRFLNAQQRASVQADVETSGQPGKIDFNTPLGPVGGTVFPGGQTAPAGIGTIGVSQSPQDRQFSDTISTESGKKLMEGRDTARAMAESIDTIHRSRDLIKSGAILGQGADLITDAGKVLNQMGFNVSPEQIANTDVLRSTLGEALLKNAKQLGVNPTDADARRLDQIVGTINKDPNALPALLDWQEAMARKAIKQHNDIAMRVRSPYPLSIDMPPEYAFKGGVPTPGNPAGKTPGVKRFNPATGRIE